METKISLPQLQVPVTFPILIQINLVHVTHTTSWRCILILSYHLRMGLPSGLFPSVFPTKTRYIPLLSPNVLHVPPISFFSILSPEVGTYYGKLNYVLMFPVFTFHTNTRWLTCNFCLIFLCLFSSLLFYLKFLSVLACVGLIIIN